MVHGILMNSPFSLRNIVEPTQPNLSFWQSVYLTDCQKWFPWSVDDEIRDRSIPTYNQIDLYTSLLYPKIANTYRLSIYRGKV